MRGTQDLRARVGINSGIIPAYAGNTRRKPADRTDGGDHPRVCGEHVGHGWSFACLQGSSPRMRGTPSTSNFPICSSGIIPAYAGNTSLSRLWQDCRWDHPRVCGEHLEQVARRIGQEGSSPRMRGTPDTLVTPRYESWDHPRVCGEHLAKHCSGHRKKGSSPRMRGTR